MNGQSSKRRKLNHDSDDGISDEELPQSSSGKTTFSIKQSSQDSRKPTSNVRSSRKPGSMSNGAPNSSVLTGGMNKTSLLVLQVEDLLAEISVNDYTPDLVSTFDAIKLAIQNALPRKQQTYSVATKTLLKSDGVAVQWARQLPENDTSYKFEFEAPQSVRTGRTSSRDLDSEYGGDLSLSITMPSNLFQEKDFLNYRALNKRAFFLACIAASIKNSLGSKVRIMYDYKDGIRYLPILIILPKPDDSQNRVKQSWCLVVDVEFPSEVIPLERTLPSRNCVRSADLNVKSGPHPPTPFYNSVVRGQAVIAKLDDMITKSSQKCSSFVPACRLGHVWLQQRGFSSRAEKGGFGAREWTLITALLLTTGGHKDTPLFSDRYSTIQLFKAMLQVLANRDLLEPWVVGKGSHEVEQGDSPVLMDMSLGFNIMFKMSSWSYQNLRHQAQLSLQTINSKGEESFDSTFVTRVATPLLQYDEIVFLNLSQMGTSKINMHDTDQLNTLYQVIRRGLGDRVTLINLEIPSLLQWKLNQQSSTTPPTLHTIQLRIVTNPETKHRLVDHGPAAEEHEASADFRQFWGSKAELRRFKDGSISESLVWSETIASSIIMQILEHLLELHFQIPKQSIVSKHTDTLPRQYLDSTQTSSPSSTAINSTNAFKLINSTYQTLSSTLHQLDGLPLPIRSISPAHPALRSSSLAHPLYPETPEPIDIIIQFDSSGRWPDALPAIQYTKIAFLQKLGEILSTHNTELITRVGLENADTVTLGHLNVAFLDVIYPSPAPGQVTSICFRARIHHEREMQLLQDGVSDKTLHGSMRDVMSKALITYRRNYLAKPIHTTTIRSLCSRFVLLEDTIRLLKQWTASHLVLYHVPEEVLEIIAAQVFLKPAPWSVPGSATTAFLRCLYRLSKWDWTASPLIVDLSLSQDMTEVVYNDLQTRFQAWRKLDPSLNNVIWMVGTNIDPTGTVWTQYGRPPRVIAARISALANAAIETVKQADCYIETAGWTNLFTSPLDDFDFLIRLNPTVVRSASGNSKNQKSNRLSRHADDQHQFKNLQLQTELDVSSIGYDPIGLFLADLENAFGSAALFFYNSNGGTVIAGLWRPAVYGTKEWRVRLGYSTVPVSGLPNTPNNDDVEVAEKGFCQINRGGILTEIAMIGQGIVKKITTKSTA